MKIQKKITNSNKTRRSRDIKVVYISSPMKVKTSASEFRALVQELTGRHSDTSRFMEMTSTTSPSATSPKETLFDSDNISHDEDFDHNQQQQQLLKSFDHSNYNDDLNNHGFPFSNYALYDDQPPKTSSLQPSFQSMFDDTQQSDHLIIDDDVFVSNSYIIDYVL